jgi:hypothetical protein
MEIQLDLSQFRNSVIGLSDTQINEFKAEAERKQIMKNGTYILEIEDVLEVKSAQNDNAWIQAKLRLGCAEGTRDEFLMIPLTNRFEFGPKATRFVICKTVETLNALGFNTEQYRNSFFNKVIVTNAECLVNLKGFRLQYSLEWDLQAVHFEFDRDAQVYFLHDGTGKRWSPQPFVGEVAERKRRAMDYCAAANVRFQENPRTGVSPDANAKNPVVSFLQQGPALVVAAPSMPMQMSTVPAVGLPPAPPLIAGSAPGITAPTPSAPLPPPPVAGAMPVANIPPPPPVGNDFSALIRPAAPAAVSTDMAEDAPF